MKNKSALPISILTGLLLTGCAMPKGSVKPAINAPAPVKAPSLPEGKPLPLTSGEVPVLVSTCQRVAGSGPRIRVEFAMEGDGTLKKPVSLKEVYALAKRKALRRIMQCSGVERILSGIYDRTDQSGPESGDAARVEREVRDGLGIHPQYRTVEEPCIEKEETLSCRILLMGSLDLDRLDGRFSILSSGTGRQGVYQEGASVRLRFFLKRRAYVYLFDVDEEGRGVLLFPGALSDAIDNPIPSNAPITFPPNSRPGVRLMASLPVGKPIAVGHIWILALHTQRFLDQVDLRKMGYAQGDLPHVENFQKTILTRFRKSIQGKAWSLRVIPYKVIGKKGPPAVGSTNHPKK